MSLKCIVDKGWLDSISIAAINNCYGTYIRIYEQNNKVLIYGTTEEFSIATTLSGRIPLFVELMQPCGTAVFEELYTNFKHMYIASEHKEIIRELFLYTHNMDLGIIEQNRILLHVFDSNEEYFVKFIILHYEYLTRDIIQKWFNTNPSIQIYVRGVSTTKHINDCIYWGVHGVITPAVEMVQNYLKLRQP